MGRKPEPTSLKLVKGVRSDRINTAEPVPAAADLVAPSDLSDEAKAVWESLAPDLLDKQVLTAWDTHEFAIFCDAVARHGAARRLLDEEGEVVDRGNGPAKHPSFQIWRDTADLVVKIGARFGLSPSDRSQLKVNDGGSDNPKERLLS